MNNTMRVGVIGLVFAALLAVLGMRLWTMQVTEVYAYEERAAKQQVRVVTTPAPRGNIFSADGVKLAGTRSALAAVVDLALVDKDELGRLAENLGAFLLEPASDILEQLSEDNRGAQITVAKDLTDAQATFLLEHREDFPGVTVIPQPIRTYPLGDIAAHVLGYIGRPNEEDLERDDVDGNDFVGRAGVEKSYDVQLQGIEGIVQYRVDAKRKVLSLVGEQAPTAGGSLVLTVDSKVQEQLQESLRDGLMQARRLEMEERAAELMESSRPERLAAALAEARLEAAKPQEESTEATSDIAAVGVDDDDVAREREPITVDPVGVLGPLYPVLPVDSDGVCVPVQRVTIPLGGEGVLSGIEPQFMRLDAVAEMDGDLIATVSMLGTKTSVRANGYVDEARQILQVLRVLEDEIVLLQKDPWCPVRATGVVIDPNDGSVIAMSSFPTFNPTVFVDGLSAAQWASLGTVGAFQNFAVQGLYAPASTFKVVPYILAVEEDFYPLDRGAGDKVIADRADSEDESKPLPLQSDTDLYYCGGEFKFPLTDGSVQRKRDWKWPGSHGLLDLHGALEASCDLYFWDLALRLWEERKIDIDKENLLQDWARSFGFGTETGIDLPFEKAGLIPDRAWFKGEQNKKSGRVRSDGPWVGGDLMDIAVGQGATLTTPLQLANGFAAMVNGGIVWQPRVVAQIIDADGEVIEENPRTIVSKVDIDPRTVTMLLQDLQQVVNNQKRGTARAAFTNFGDNVDLVGGKTGTSEVIKASRAEHFRQVDDALFVGVAPINNPKWVISVIVERGGSGGRIAAPVARQVLQYLLNGADGVTELAPGLDTD
ncbi:MAG: penicillin-binding transpeptidase domain-containing protein [Acidimicrobiia bacterium]